MLLALLGEGSGGSASGPCVDDDRNWFWFELDRWPHAEVTNGPRLTSPSSESAYRQLVAAQQVGTGDRRRCLLQVYVRGKVVLGAIVGTSSGDLVLDDLARRLYPPPERDLEGAEAFAVSVYGRKLAPESTFSVELP
jgi:hypothetical protein